MAKQQRQPQAAEKPPERGYSIQLGGGKYLRCQCGQTWRINDLSMGLRDGQVRFELPARVREHVCGPARQEIQFAE